MTRDHNESQSFVAALAQVRAKGSSADKVCPSCHARIARAAKACQCGYSFVSQTITTITGEWTREPPSIAGYYWARDLQTRNTYPAWYLAGEVEHRDIDRWSVRLEAPK